MPVKHRTSAIGRTSNESVSYYDWTVRQLKKRARERGMSGYSTLTKEDLIFRLRYY